jgi:hypothetical protein
MMAVFVLNQETLDARAVMIVLSATEQTCESHTVDHIQQADGHDLA